MSASSNRPSTCRRGVRLWTFGQAIATPFLKSVPAGCLTTGICTDMELLGYALQLEYLEGMFYSCAATGSPLNQTLTGNGPPPPSKLSLPSCLWHSKFHLPTLQKRGQQLWSKRVKNFAISDNIKSKISQST